MLVTQVQCTANIINSISTATTTIDLKSIETVSLNDQDVIKPDVDSKAIGTSSCLLMLHLSDFSSL